MQPIFETVLQNGDRRSVPSPSCGHMEYCSPRLSKPGSLVGFCPAWGLRIPATALDILGGSDFSSICSKPTRPPPMLWSWLCMSLLTSAATGIPPVLLTWQPQPHMSSFSLTMEGTWDLCALRWPHRDAAEVGAAITWAGPRPALLFTSPSVTHWQSGQRLCGRCSPLLSFFSILSCPVGANTELVHSRPSRDLPLSAVKSPKLSRKRTKLHPNPRPSATPAGTSFSFILLLLWVSPGAVSHYSLFCVSSTLRGGLSFQRPNDGPKQGSVLSSLTW